MKRLMYGAVLSLALAAGAFAGPLTLVVVDSFARSGPFALAFDGTNIQYALSTGGGLIHEMTTAGVDTGKTTPRIFGGALAWDPIGKQLMGAGSGQIHFFDLYTGLNERIVNTPAGGGLIDGLGQGPATGPDAGEIWYSPDVGPIFRLNPDGSFKGTNPVPAGGGAGFSGVERIDPAGGSPFIIAVNDASSPRKLCKYNLDGSAEDCATVPNSRYEDLAFDGRYLYAADFFGNKIDKIDLLGPGGGSILQPGVPEPASMLLLGSGLAALAAFWRKKARASR